MSIDWTHKKVSIQDIRKVKKFYILSIDDKKITSPLFVDHSIFEGRVNSFYLKDNYDFSREDILKVKWNLVITQGFFYKTEKDGGEFERVDKDKDKFYVSFLEIDGILGTHVPR